MVVPALDERLEVLGCQTPRLYVVPAGPKVYDLGQDTIDLCGIAGMALDDWQELAVREGLAQTPGGRFVAQDVGVECCRQNGKGEILLARVLCGLFLLNEFMLPTAHETKTNNETWERLLDLLRGTPEFAKRVPRPNIRLANGEQGVKVIGGGRARFIARSTGSGRGFPGVKCIIWDEAQILEDAQLAAAMPAQRATAQPQGWYFGTAPGPKNRERAVVFGKMRRQAKSGQAKRLVWLEWSADEDAYDIDSRDDWAKANPALGVRIAVETMEHERLRLSEPDFLAECMGVGQWPGDSGFGVIPEAKWAVTEDPAAPRPSEPVVFAVDAMPDRSTATIAVAGWRDDGTIGVEIVDREPGVDWAASSLADLCQTYACLGIVVDKGGPAGTLVPALENEGLELIVPTTAELALAAQGFHDAAVGAPPRVRRPPDARLDAAVAAARRRPMGRDAWYWARPSNGDVCPLTTVSLAYWALERSGSADAQPGAWLI